MCVATRYDSAVEAFATTLSLNPSFREARSAAVKAARASVRQHKAHGTEPPQTTSVFAKALRQQQRPEEREQEDGQAQEE